MVPLILEDSVLSLGCRLPRSGLLHGVNEDLWQGASSLGELAAHQGMSTVWKTRQKPQLVSNGAVKSLYTRTPTSYYYYYYYYY